MCTLANPLEAESHFDTSQKQTVEMRSPDGSADLYQLLAGLAVACRHGFEIENALDIAEKTYVNVNIHQKENEDKLHEIAKYLLDKETITGEEFMEIYEKNDADVN